MVHIECKWLYKMIYRDSSWYLGLLLNLRASNTLEPWHLLLKPYKLGFLVTIQKHDLMTWPLEIKKLGDLASLISYNGALDPSPGT